MGCAEKLHTITMLPGVTSKQTRLQVAKTVFSNPEKACTILQSDVMQYIAGTGVCWS